jgi:hypothetical protein
MVGNVTVDESTAYPRIARGRGGQREGTACWDGRPLKYSVAWARAKRSSSNQAPSGSARPMQARAIDLARSTGQGQGGAGGLQQVYRYLMYLI